MASIPKRGAVASPGGSVYRDPANNGVKDTGGPGSYRPPADGVKDITEIGYIPYGGVYEREGLHPFERVATGGVYEVFTEPKPELVITLIASLTYPPVNTDTITASSVISGGSVITPPLDDIEVFDSKIASGTLIPILQTYSNWPVEEIEVFDEKISGGTLVTALLTYTIPTEDIEVVDSKISSGTLTSLLISYTNWPAETIQANSIISGGTLA